MALISTNMLKAAVLITTTASNGQWMESGTGFLYGTGMTNPGEGTIRFEEIYVVTCAHVIDGAEKASSQIWSNRESGGVVAARQSSKMWVTHPEWKEDRRAEHDIAVTRFLTIRDHGGAAIEWRPFLEDEVWTKEQILRKRVWEGNPIITWGFPSAKGIRHPEEHHPFLRRGVIARMQPWLQGIEETFAIDAAAFPGQSGSPVVLEPVVMQIEGHPDIRAPKLIGMLCQAPLREAGEIVVIGDGMTGEPEGKKRTAERIGIGIVVPTGAILETIQHLEDGER